MASVYEVSKQYREKILALDNQTSREMVGYYQYSYRQIEADLSKLTSQIEAKKSNGEEVSLAWVKKQERYKELLAQIDTQMVRFSGKATELVEKGQSKAGKLGLKGAEDAVAAANVGIEWNRVPVEAVEALSGALADESPLRELFDGLGVDASLKARETLHSAVVRGLNPRQTAREMKESFGGNLSRALTVARTEQLRAYREATHLSYQENSDALDGWVRLETIDESTCIICISEHGKEYQTSEMFETHPNCRGTMIPKVKGHDLGIKTGPEVFATWDEDRQKEILGEAKFEAFKAGEIDLPSLVERTYSEKWGGGRKEVSLEAAKEAFKRVPEPISIDFGRFKDDFNNKTEDVWKERKAARFDGTKMPYAGWDQKETGRLEQERYLLDWEKSQGPATVEEKSIVKEIQGWDGYKKVSEDITKSEVFENLLRKYKTSEDLVVYHGTNITPAKLEALKSGNEKIISQPILSTSLSRGTASGYMRNADADKILKEQGRTEGVVYKIHLPEGSPAIPVEGISPRNGYGIGKNENKNTLSILGEVALGPTEYEIIKVETTEKGLPIIHMIPKEAVKQISEELPTVTLNEAIENWYDYGNANLIKEWQRGTEPEGSSSIMDGSSISKETALNVKAWEEKLQEAAQVRTDRMLTYRGEVVDGKAEFEERFKIGEVYETDSLTSTSPIKEVANMYNDLVNFDIFDETIPILLEFTDSNGLIGLQTKLENEEFILAKGAKFKVSRITKQEDGVYKISLHRTKNFKD